MDLNQLQMGTIKNGPAPLHVALLGCGFITQVHSDTEGLRSQNVCSYASRASPKAKEY